MQGQNKKNNEQHETHSKEYLQKLGKRIKELRIKAGYTSYEFFAYEHNISRAQWGRYENGQDLKFSSLVKIIEAFKMTLPEFFKEGFD
ncbi:helix-turn-helix domain-containing protein [Rubrolithibacter danxiaensis]|uniref:helix-turn-helix domain-containing protein n=1 Tax=Rubrolithibacter danxiaensis TaxID=3390805 RepID=UPI003BF8659D